MLQWNPTKLRRAFVHSAYKCRRSIPGAPEADVAVRVRRRIVQVQREDARVRRVVPIATTLKRNRCWYQTHPRTGFLARIEFWVRCSA